jgi:prepilin-type N-terminal cleavage/methylation domain-containing protein
MSRNSCRRAFSLVEILAVIAIIGILVTLLVPAVQRMRKEADRVTCANNLSQVGLAMQNFLALNKVFPSNGGWDGKQTIQDVNGQQFTPETYDYTTNRAYACGVGDPKFGPKAQTGSWAYALLPYIDQDVIYNEREWTVAMPTYICPSRRSSQPTPTVDGDAVGKYKGGGWSWARTDYGVNLKAFDNRPVCHSDKRFQDGLSNTILVGEKSYDRSVQEKSWYYDEPYFLGGSKGTARDAPVMTPDGPSLDGTYVNYKDYWGSTHSAGVHFLFGDGTVRLLNFDMDKKTLFALMTPDGKETVTPP